MAGSYGISIINFLGNCYAIFHRTCNHFTFSPAILKGSNYSTSSQTLVFVFCFSLFVLDTSHPNVYEVVSHCDFDVRFPIAMLSTICISSLEKCLFKPFAHFLSCVFFVVVQLFIYLFIYLFSPGYQASSVRLSWDSLVLGSSP